MGKIEHYVPSSKINSAADIERAAAGVIDVDAKTTRYVQSISLESHAVCAFP